MASPDNLRRIRDKDAIISKIDIPKDKLEVLQSVASNDKLSSDIRKKVIKELCDGLCCMCGSAPTQIVTYKLEGATRIEKYCDKCVNSVYVREQVI